MRFKVDENLPNEAAQLLRQHEFDTATVLEQSLGGRDDPDIIAVCQQERRTLITLDTDFSDIRAYPPEQYAGLIVLRLRWQDKPHVLRVIERLVKMVSVEPLDGFLWIVEEDRIRIRGQTPQQ